MGTEGGYKKKLTSIVNEKDIEFRKGVKVFVPFPFAEVGLHLYNRYYLMLSQLLEYGTNRLIYTESSGNIVPVEFDNFAIIWQRAENSVRSCIRAFALKRVICIVHFFDHVEFFVNPNFMFYGDGIPKFLVDLFKETEIAQERRVLLKYKFVRPDWNIISKPPGVKRNDKKDKGII